MRVLIFLAVWFFFASSALGQNLGDMVANSPIIIRGEVEKVTESDLSEEKLGIEPGGNKPAKVIVKVEEVLKGACDEERVLLHSGPVYVFRSLHNHYLKFEVGQKFIFLLEEKPHAKGVTLHLQESVRAIAEQQKLEKLMQENRAWQMAFIERMLQADPDLEEKSRQLKSDLIPLLPQKADYDKKAAEAMIKRLNKETVEVIQLMLAQLWRESEWDANFYQAVSSISLQRANEVKALNRTEFERLLDAAKIEKTHGARYLDHYSKTAHPNLSFPIVVPVFKDDQSLVTTSFLLRSQGIYRRDIYPAIRMHNRFFEMLDPDRVSGKVLELARSSEYAERNIAAKAMDALPMKPFVSFIYDKLMNDRETRWLARLDWGDGELVAQNAKAFMEYAESQGTNTAFWSMLSGIHHEEFVNGALRVLERSEAEKISDDQAAQEFERELRSYIVEGIQKHELRFLRRMKTADELRQRWETIPTNEEFEKNRSELLDKRIEQFKRDLFEEAVTLGVPPKDEESSLESDSRQREALGRFWDWKWINRPAVETQDPFGGSVSLPGYDPFGDPERGQENKDKELTPLDVSMNKIRPRLEAPRFKNVLPKGPVVKLAVRGDRLFVSGGYTEYNHRIQVYGDRTAVIDLKGKEEPRHLELVTFDIDAAGQLLAGVKGGDLIVMQSDGNERWRKPFRLDPKDKRGYKSAPAGAFAPDGTSVVFSSFPRGWIRYDTDTGEPIAEYGVLREGQTYRYSQEFPVSGLTMAPDGKAFIAATIHGNTSSSSLFIEDKLSQDGLGFHMDGGTSAAFSLDGRWIVGGSMGGVVLDRRNLVRKISKDLFMGERVELNRRTLGRRLPRIIPESRGPEDVVAVAFSPDSKWLATVDQASRKPWGLGDRHTLIRVFETEKWSLHAVYEAGELATGICWQLDNRKAFVGHVNGDVSEILLIR